MYRKETKSNDRQISVKCRILRIFAAFIKSAFLLIIIITYRSKIYCFHSKDNTTNYYM
jgi:hypothetical protein